MINQNSIKNLLQDKNMTQKSLAEQLGLDPINFNKIVNIFEDNKNFYIVSERSNDVSLLKSISREKNYSEFDVANIIR